MTMCKEYNHSVKHMKALMVKAERILAYMQMCRKYETQDEKILPIMNSYPMQLSLTDDNDVIPIQMVKIQFFPYFKKKIDTNRIYRIDFVSFFKNFFIKI